MRAEGGIGIIGGVLLIGFSVSRLLPYAIKLTLTSNVLVLPYFCTDIKIFLFLQQFCPISP